MEEEVSTKGITCIEVIFEVVKGQKGSQGKNLERKKGGIKLHLFGGMHTSRRWELKR
jgi:hypothetical protein